MIRASRRRRTAVSGATSAPCSRLTATLRSSDPSCARNTAPPPPAPNRRTTRYRPPNTIPVLMRPDLPATASYRRCSRSRLSASARPPSLRLPLRSSLLAAEPRKRSRAQLDHGHVGIQMDGLDQPLEAGGRHLAAGVRRPVGVQV